MKQTAVSSARVIVMDRDVSPAEMAADVQRGMAVLRPILEAAIHEQAGGSDRASLVTWLTQVAHISPYCAEMVAEQTLAGLCGWETPIVR